MSNGEIRREKLPQFAVGDGESTESAVQRWLSAQEYIEKGPLGAHFAWYTHRNPAGCWICDLCTLNAVSMRQVQRLAEQLSVYEQRWTQLARDEAGYQADGGEEYPNAGNENEARGEIGL